MPTLSARCAARIASDGARKAFYRIGEYFCLFCGCQLNDGGYLFKNIFGCSEHAERAEFHARIMDYLERTKISKFRRGE